jgi:hypothetical protein
MGSGWSFEGVSDVNGDLRTLLQEKAEEVRVDPRIPPVVLRRSRRRRVATGVLAGVVTAAVAAGSLVVVRTAMSTAPAPPPQVGAGTQDSRPPQGYPFIYPPTEDQLENTREQLPESMVMWTEPRGAAELFAVNVMGWGPQDVEIDVRGDQPVTAFLSNPSLSPDVRTVLTLLRVPGPGPTMYAVVAAEAENMDVEPVGPDDQIRSGSAVAFRGRLSVVPPGANVALTVNDGPPVPAPVTDGSFVVEADLPEGRGNTLVSIAIVDGSGNTWMLTSSRLGVPVQSGGASSGPVPASSVELLPEAVAATREAILEAVQARDWEALRALIPAQGFTYTFGEAGDPIAYWQDLEEEGVPVLPNLEALLESPHGRLRGAYIWPAPAGKDATEWTERDLAILDQLTAAGVLTERENRDYQEFDYYYGWRVGIDRDGTWIFYVAGD